MKMNLSDPWKDLERPAPVGRLCTRRVDPDVEWGFYWGRSHRDELLFIVRHCGPEVGKDRIPRLRGISVLDEAELEGSERVLILQLDDVANRDVFAELCRDIVRSAGHIASDAEAVSHTLMRTWKWHHLMRGGTSRRLSLEQQKGLVAELLFLRDVAMPRLGASRAVRSWRGPFGSPKDFTFGHAAVEVKSVRSVGPRHIRISSAEQLATDGLVHLLLYVRIVDSGEDSQPGAVTLDDVVDSVAADIGCKSPQSKDVFEQVLFASGYDEAHDYSGNYWLPGDAESFAVREGFPRITPCDLVAGVGDVVYTVNRDHCRPYAVAAEFLDRVLREAE